MNGYLHRGGSTYVHKIV